MAGNGPNSHPESRSDRNQLAWSVLLNVILIAAVVLGVIPIVAILRGFVELVTASKTRSGADWVAYGFAFTGLFLGAVFFAYAIKYYLSTVMVLLTTLVFGSPRNTNGNGHGNGHSLSSSTNLTGHRRLS